jgi:hypothetical protein
MSDPRSSHPRFHISLPPMIALGIAVLGTLTLLVIDHGPWNDPDDELVTGSVMPVNAAEARAGVIVVPSQMP